MTATRAKAIARKPSFEHHLALDRRPVDAAEVQNRLNLS